MAESELLVAMVCGVLLTVVVEVFIVFMWIYSKPPEPVAPRGQFSPYVPAHSPPAASRSCSSTQQRESHDRHSASSPSSSFNKETCEWLNYVIDFLFQELRDSPEVHRLVTKQLNKEFQELMMTKLEGKMIEQLAIREFTMGNSLPTFSDIELVTVKRDSDDEESGRPELIEMLISVDYNGGFHVAIDADLMFQKAAYVSIDVQRVCGRGRLQLSRQPFTHWSFAFLEFPFLDFNVTSRFEGRILPHLSNFIETQFKRWVKKKHTLPNYKVRFKPIFKRVQPQTHLLDVHVHDKRLTLGTLVVCVENCTRLQIADLAVGLYCTLEIASAPRVSQFGVWRTAWPLLDVSLTRTDPEHTIGIGYKMLEDDVSLTATGQQIIVINRVDEDSLAYHAGVRKGDILYKIDNVKVTGTKQAEKLIKKSRSKRLLLVIQRPPKHAILLKKLEHGRNNQKRPRSRTFSHQTSQRPSSEAATASRADEGFTEINTNDLLVHSLEEPRSHSPRSSTRQRGEDTMSLAGIDGERKPRSSSMMTHRVTDNLFLSKPMKEKRDQSRGHSPQASPSSPSSSSSNSPSSRNPRINVTTKHAKTKSVSPTSRNPKWNQEFQFDIKPEDNYCNVCVWCKLQGEQGGDLLIGYVTVSLTDIALLCASNTSGQYHQRYTLTPSHEKLANKAALKVSTPQLPQTASYDFGPKKLKYAGDILLRFLHTPGWQDDNSNRPRSRSRQSTERREAERPGEGLGEAERLDSVDDASLQRDSERETLTRISDVHQDTSQRSHHFVAVEQDVKTLECNKCKKKAGAFKKLMKCRGCEIVAHKNCMKYYMENTSCDSPCNFEEDFHSSFDAWEDIPSAPTDRVSPSVENTDDEESRTFPSIVSYVTPPEDQFGLPPFLPTKETEVQESKQNESAQPALPVPTLPNILPDPVQLSPVEEGIEGVDSLVKYSETRSLALPNTPPIDKRKFGGGVSEQFIQSDEYDESCDADHSADENYTPPLSEDEEEHRPTAVSKQLDKEDHWKTEDDEEEDEDEEEEMRLRSGGTATNLTAGELNQKVLEAKENINMLAIDKQAVEASLENPNITPSEKTKLIERLEKLEQQLESTQLWVTLYHPAEMTFA